MSTPHAKQGEQWPEGKPLAKPQPEGGRTLAEARTHQRYLRERAEIAERRVRQLEADAVAEQAYFEEEKGRLQAIIDALPQQEAVEAAHAVHRGTAAMRLSTQGVERIIQAALQTAKEQVEGEADRG